MLPLTSVLLRDVLLSAIDGLSTDGEFGPRDVVRYRLVGYENRILAWEQLISLHEQVGPPLSQRPEVVELGSLIRKAASLDHRTDRFEAVAPVRLMDGDRVPRIE